MRFIPWILLLALLSGCKQSPKVPENFDYGKIENGVYSNNYFDFEIPVPDKWVVQNQEQVKQLQKQGEDLIAGNNKELAAKVKAANVGTAILLTVFKNKTDSNINEFNSSFIILAENLGNSGVKKAEDYLVHAKAIMQQSSISYQFSPDFFSERIGNKEFEGMNTAMNSNGVTVQQVYYSMIDKNFAVSMIISFARDEQKRELKDIINKIKFK